MRKLILSCPFKGLSMGPAYRKWGQPRVPGRYRVCDYRVGTVTKHTLSRRGAIRTFQHTAKKGWF
ncbi:hypothetical protein [Streptomyces prunicolor]|uniref:hypothetical protein n=1 Tax=Streptomyces prunicolor TaxID=67348 RepID=UPI0033F26228